MITKLFFDRYHISMHGLMMQTRGECAFECCPPQKPDKPFLTADRPWESMSCGWGTLMIENGLYRLWYEAWDKEYTHDCDGRLCYAESTDGVNWVKPSLGIIEYKGSRDNNIVIDRSTVNGFGFHGHSIFVDPTSPACARYRCVYLGHVPRAGHGDMTVMSTAYSPDGLHWTWGAPDLPNDFLHPGTTSFGSDTQCVVRWDNELRKYVGYFRTWAPNGCRTIARSETNTLYDWPVPKTILSPDNLDAYNSDYYNSAASKYCSGGDIGHFMFISVFDHLSDTLDVRLATSRDGIIYDRFDRKPFIKNDRPFDSGGVYVCPGIQTVGGECVMAYSATARKHGESEATINYSGGLVMLKFKRDRFQGLDTKTKFEFAVVGEIDPRCPITVNADIRGSLRAGLIEGGAYGRYIEGFAPEDCVPLKGDGTDLELRWRGGKPSAEKAELKILLEDATIYSVTSHDD
jgi:hypothetical protein